MLNIIIPLFAVLIAFLATLASVRFALTRQGRLYWIIPVLISSILFYQNLSVLLQYGSSDEPYPLTFTSILPLSLSILWYAMVVSFHYALKTNREYNKYVEESRSTYNEAKFLSAMEARQNRKEKREIKEIIKNSTRDVNIPEYTFPDEKY